MNINLLGSDCARTASCLSCPASLVCMTSNNLRGDPVWNLRGDEITGVQIVLLDNDPAMFYSRDLFGYKSSHNVIMLEGDRAIVDCPRIRFGIKGQIMRQRKEFMQGFENGSIA